MKKLLPLFIILLILAVTAVIFISLAKNEQPVTIIKGNTAQKPWPLKIGFTNDPYCKMLIKEQRNTAQVISSDGNTWFFDDPGCMVLWLEDKTFKQEAKLWVYTLDTKQWIDAKKAWYGIKDPTAMEYGFGAREKKETESIPYDEMRLRMLRGENLTNPKIRKKLLGE